MLKRIKIRGKLLLLLAVPTVAVLVFAATGVLDRLDKSDFLEREARIAELADAGSDLSLAVQVQRTRSLSSEAGADVDLAEAEEATSIAIDRWLRAAAAVRPDITEGEVVAQIDTLADSLQGLDAGVDEMSAFAISVELSTASRQVTALTPRLLDQPGELALFRALANHLRVAQIQNAVGEITALGASSIEQGNVPAVTSTLLDAADLQIASGIDQLLTTADDEYSEMVLTLQGDGLLPDAGRRSSVSDIEFIIDTGSDTALVDWLLAGEERLSGVNAVSDAILEDASSTAADAAASAQEEATSFMILAGSVVLAALVMALLVGRSISRPLTKLTRSADQLSAEELPALVESLRSAGRTELPELTQIEVKGRDEVAKLAGAISEIQQVTMDVAEEQGELLRRGISDIFVNLARRNQSLLDRQIDFIDQLEAREENPDQLENLFRLDHLATRMRRNAESLLVLAGQEPSRRRGRPVEVADVVRVAMGEIEDYSRIRLNTIDPATVAGSVAVDLAHLLSELMENATQFSPPEAGVDVMGHRTGDGSYQLTLADRGIGMSAEAIIASNRTLSEPPLVGLDLSRSLGFTVVSRLAHRLGVRVELTSSAQGGVTATVAVPAAMVGEIAPTEEASAPTAPQAPAPATPLVADSESSVATEDPPLAAVPSAADAAATEPEPAPPAPPKPEPSAPQPAGEHPVEPSPHRFTPAPFAPVADEPETPATPSAPAAPAAPSAPAPEPVASSGDMFDVFGAAPAAGAPSPDPKSDIFAPLDAEVTPLPRRVRAKPEADSSTPPTPPAATPPDPVAPSIATPSPFAPTKASPVAPGPSPFAPPSTPAAAAPTDIAPTTDQAPPLLPTRRPAPPDADDASTTEQPPTPPLPTRPAPADADNVSTTEQPPTPPLPTRPAPADADNVSMTDAGLVRRTPRQVAVPDVGNVSAEEQQAAPTRSPEEVREMLSRYRSGLRKGREPGPGNNHPSNEG